MCQIKPVETELRIIGSQGWGLEGKPEGLLLGMGSLYKVGCGDGYTSL